MKSFLKLFNFEFNRFFKLYIGIFVCMFVFQIGGAIVSSLLYKKQINELVNQGAGQNAITEQMEPFGLLRSEEHTSELQSRFDLVYLYSFPTRRSSDLEIIFKTI